MRTPTKLTIAPTIAPTRPGLVVAPPGAPLKKTSVASSTASIAMAAMATTRAMDLRGIYFAYLSFLHTPYSIRTYPENMTWASPLEKQAVSIHRIAEKGSSQKPFQPIYAASCMSIRATLQAVASLSDGSTYLLGWNGKTLPRMGAGILP